GIHTDDPNNSCRFCPNWPCAGLAAVARAGGPSTKPLKEVFASQSCDESGPPLQSAEGRCYTEFQSLRPQVVHPTNYTRKPTDTASNPTHYQHHPINQS